MSMTRQPSKLARQLLAFVFIDDSDQLTLSRHYDEAIVRQRQTNALDLAAMSRDQQFIAAL